MSRITAISFYSTVDASSKKTLVSKRINTPFCVKKIRAYFGSAADYGLNLSFFVSPDSAAPTDARPNGTNLLAEYGQVSYITGDGQNKLIEIETEVYRKGHYLKVYAENGTAATVKIDALITIEIIEEERVRKTKTEALPL